MKNFRQRSHSAEFLFPLLLFFLFALLATETVLFAAGGYRKILEKRSMNDEAGTCICYIREKIHQNDADGNVELADLSGIPALVLKKSAGEKLYMTYIYSYNGEIRELFAQENAAVTLDSGTAILKITDLKMQQLGERLFYITCTDEGGNTAESYVCARSGKDK